MNNERRRLSPRDATGAGEILPHHHLRFARLGLSVRGDSSGHDLFSDAYRKGGHHAVYLAYQRLIRLALNDNNTGDSGRAPVAIRRRAAAGSRRSGSRQNKTATTTTKGHITC